MKPGLFFTTIVFACVGLVLSSCMDLAGEPEIVSTIPPRPTVPAAISAPETLDVPVSMEQGAQIYAQNCTRCHGAGGAGDGEFVQSGQITNISDLTNPATIADQSLEEWYDTITNGRIEALMPPWREALSAEERWAVALYTYTLSYDEATIERGETLYAAQCADCHGENGGGSENGSVLIGLVDPAESDLASAIAAHHTDLELASQLEDGDAAALTQYVRLLSTTSRALPDAAAIEAFEPPVTTPEVGPTEVAAAPPAAPESIGILRGQVIQGTADGGPVEGVEAVIHIYDNQLREQIAESIVGPDGTYQYDEVVIRPDFAYRMTAEYDGITYSSPVMIGDPAETEMILDVTVYENGTDDAALAITSRATQINLTPQGLYVIEVIDMVNNADRAYLRENVEGVDEPVSVGFPIPEGAQLQLEHTDPNRILLSEDGRTIYDAAPMLPGAEHYVQFSYLLPIADAQAINQPVEYTVTGEVAFFIENASLEFESEDATFTESLLFNNQEYSVFSVAQPPAAGERIDYAITLRNNPSGGSGDIFGISQSMLALGFVVIGVALVGGAGFVFWQGRRSAAPAAADASGSSSETLIKLIAELDDSFEAGEISKADYEKQRDALKARLMHVMKSQQND